MKKTLKRSLSLLLAVAIIFSSMYVGLSEVDFNGLFAVRAEAASISSLTFNLSSDGTSYYVYDCDTTATGDLVIPSKYNSLPVTSIGSYAFDKCAGLTSITIPDEVKSIEALAFNECTGLKTIDLGNGVTSIGTSAFKNCTSLTSITIPDSVTSLSGTALFDGCTNLSTIVIGNGITSIDPSMFKNLTNLSSVTIGIGVTSVGSYAFSNCTNLTSITIPDNVTSIGSYAFENCENLTSVTVGEGVQSIDLYAFNGCSKLTSIILGKGLTKIGISTFYNCSGLKYVFYTGTKEQWNSIDIGVNNTDLTSKPIHYEATDHTYGDYTYDYSTNTKTRECIICGNSTSAELSSVDSLTFTLDSFNKSYVVSDCDTSASGVIDIPATYNGLPVTEIGQSAFVDCTEITYVSIPDSVYRIGFDAFNGTNIESVTIPGSVEVIYQDAFSNCSQLKSVVVKEGVKYIYRASFTNCENLTSIQLPDSIISIFENEFTGTAYYNDSANWEDGVLYVGNHLIKADTSLSGNYTVKEGTKTIADNAFYGCANLESVTLPEGINSIGRYAFYGCSSLKNIELPEGMDMLGESAFAECTALESVAIGDGITFIWNNVFDNTAFYNNSANWQDDVLYVGNYLITAKTTLSGSYIINEGTKVIASQAFLLCKSLENVEIPDSVISIGHNAFYNTGIHNNTSNWTDGILYIDDCLIDSNDSFSGECIVKDGTRMIASAAFYLSNITSLVLPCSVENIGWFAFEYSALEKISLYNTIKNIDYRAFFYCFNIDDVEFYGTEEEWKNIQIKEGNIPLKISNISYNPIEECEHTYGEYVYDYTANTKTKVCSVCGYALTEEITSLDLLTFTLSNDGTNYSVTGCDTSASGEIVVPETYNNLPVKNIGDRAFQNCENITSVAFNGVIESIGEWAFGGCTSLADVNLGKTVTILGAQAFRDCTELKAITIPDSVQNIGEWAFSGCANLESVTIGDGVISIGNRAFQLCEKLKTVTFGENVNSIGEWAFYNCVALKTVNFNNSISSIGAAAFSDCTGLKTISILDSVKTIGERAFQSCSGLECVTIGVGLNSIGHYAFYDCTNILQATYAGTKAQWENIEIGDVNECLTDKIVFTHEHTYGEWAIDTEATCEADGSKHRTCTACGEAETEVITATGHSYSTEWTIDIAATCTTGGSKSRHCANCESKTDVTSINANGHSYGDWIVTTEPTCAELGSAERTCDACGCVQDYFDFATIDSSLYPGAEDYYQEAETEGYIVRLYNFSSDDAESLILDFSSSTKLTHLLSSINVYDENGETVGFYNNFGGSSIPSKPIIIPGSGFIIALQTPSGCDFPVFSFDSITMGHESVNYLEHNYSTEWTIDVAATCTTSGSKSHHCLNCDATTDVTEILATGHTAGEWVVTIEPTCSTEGEKTGYCSVCGEACATEAVATLEHNYDENNCEYVQNPENPNEFHKQYECEDCGTTIVDETPFVLKAIIVESLPDNTSYIEGQEIDTTGLVVKAEFEDGTTAYITDFELDYDNTVVGEQEVIVSCGDVTATFTVTFTQKSVVSIAVTKMPDKTTYVEGESFDNTGMIVTATYDNGLTEEVTDYTVSTLPKTTGTKNLIVTYSGKRVIIQVTVIEKIAVSMEVVEPENIDQIIGDDFDTTGMVVTVTYNDGTSAEVADYTIEGFGDFVGVGYVYITYGELSYELIIIAHSPEDAWVIESQSTCTTDGLKHLYCTECDEIIKSETILATGHDYSADYTIDSEATCTAEGSKSRHCSNCDSKTDVTAIAIIPHSYGDYVYDYSANTQTCECTVCGHTLTEEIPTEGLFTFVLSDDGTYYILADCSETASGEIEIPSTYKGLPVTCIGDKAFKYCENITGVIIPESIETIGEYAFAYCAFKSIKIPDSVISIGSHAFGENQYLEMVEFGVNIKDIGEGCFSACTNLEYIDIPYGVTDIKESTFNECMGLKSVTIPDSVVSIGEGAFVNCTSLSEIVIPDGVTSLGGSAFGRCTSLRSIVLPAGITEIGEYTFRECRILESVAITGKLTNIGEYCFYDCNELKYIFYAYSESDWNDITIADNNPSLEDAIIHFNCTDHTYEWIITTPATCTEYGVKSYVCSYCDLQNGTDVIYATGHSYGDWVVDSQATCEGEGSRYRACESCGNTETVTETAIGHSYGEWYLSYPLVTNCEEDSIYNRECNNCYNIEEKIVPATGTHEIYESMISVEGTCITPGQKLYECKYCEYVKYHEEYYADHVISGQIITLEATCEEDGEKYNLCSVCNENVGEPIVIAALGHDYAEEFTVDAEATCQAEGSKSRHCSRCESKIDITVIEITTHNYGDWVVTTPATCEADGERTKSCIYCGDAITETVSAYGHVYSVLWTTDKTPTCTVAGSKSHHCNRPGCDSKIDVTEIEPLGHSFGEWQIIENPSCTVNGQKYRMCNTCYSEELAVITAPGHTYGEWIIDSAADCENAGARHAVCGVCSYVNSETVKAYGHDYESVFTVDKEATCTEAGSKSHHCSRCDSVADETVILPLGHHISTMWTIDTEPTCESEGSKSHHCLRCEVVTDLTAIPVASHIYGKWEVVTPATMDTAGVRAHKCYNCEMTEDAEIPKLLKYTATFIADGDIVATVDFPEDATEIEIPEVPHKDKYNGEWENFDVQNKNFSVNAVYTPISTDDIDGVKANNSADYYSSTGEVAINLNVSAPGKTVITTTTKAIPLDIVFVLDQSGSMAENGKKDALKSAVTTFSNAILEDAIANSVDHRIAIVGFASGGNDRLNYENTELLTADVVKYNKLSEADYKNALLSVNDNGTLNSVITKAVNAIDAEGATKADLGLEMASNIFANNPVADNRQRVVVFLTDGVPTSYNNFEYGVANAAIQNAYQLKNTYDATVYSVGVFDEDTSSNNSVNNFMNYVSSNYNKEKVLKKNSTETSENTNGYYLNVSDASTLSDVFTSIVEETVTHTGKFTNATLKYTLSEYFTLTSVQEDALRLNSIESLGVANDEISITRNADGTTTIVISNIKPWAEGENQVIDFTFRATANENTLKSGTYQVGTYNSGVILENGQGFEAVFVPNSVDIGGTSGIAVFNINTVPYAINRLSSTTMVTAPATDFGADYSFTGWSVPANLTLNNEVRVFDAELTKNEYKISWNIDGEITEVTYAVGDFITVPNVGNNSIGGAFVGWDKVIPETMPSENLTITAIYDAHYHKYDVTKDFETCDQGGTLTYTCDCGDSYTEEIASTEHTWEAITGATNHKHQHNVGFRCTVCGVQDDKDLELERKDKKENADNSHNTATYEFDYVDDNGDKHQPEGDVEISVQLDDVFEGDIPEEANASVYRVNDDGSRTKLPCEQNGMNMKFKTDHFSTYEFEFTTGEQKYIFAQLGTEIDYENKIIFSDTYLAEEFVSLVTYLAPASIVANKNSYGYLATGSSVNLINGAMTDNFKVIINGDLNGDGVCDVLDASYAALVSSGHKTATEDEIYAANGEIADEIDILDYQNIVNKVVA